MIKKLLIIFLISSQFLSARNIQETTFAYWSKPDVKVYYSAPTNITENTKIIFIIHGGSRGADSYLKDWITLAEGRDAFLVAPKFSKNFFNEYAYLMKTDKWGRSLKDSSLDLDSCLLYTSDAADE